MTDDWLLLPSRYSRQYPQQLWRRRLRKRFNLRFSADKLFTQVTTQKVCLSSTTNTAKVFTWPGKGLARTRWLSEGALGIRIFGGTVRNRFHGRVRFAWPMTGELKKSFCVWTRNAARRNCVDYLREFVWVVGSLAELNAETRRDVPGRLNPLWWVVWLERRV